MEPELSVAEAAEALGTSPQTVRALLRKGDLVGRKRPWGSRFVWVVPEPADEGFLSEYGRLDEIHDGAEAQDELAASEITRDLVQALRERLQEGY